MCHFQSIKKPYGPCKYNLKPDLHVVQWKNSIKSWYLTDRGDKQLDEKEMDPENHLPDRQSIHRNFCILEISSHQYEYSIIPVLQTIDNKNHLFKPINTSSLHHSEKAFKSREIIRLARKTYQSMTPDDAESFRNSQRPEKASKEKPGQVRGQPPQTV